MKVELTRTKLSLAAVSGLLAMGAAGSASLLAHAEIKAPAGKPSVSTSAEAPEPTGATETPEASGSAVADPAGPNEPLGGGHTDEAVGATVAGAPTESSVDHQSNGQE